MVDGKYLVDAGSLQPMKLESRTNQRAEPPRSSSQAESKTDSSVEEAKDESVFEDTDLAPGGHGELQDGESLQGVSLGLWLTSSVMVDAWDLDWGLVNTGLVVVDYLQYEVLLLGVS